MPHPLSSPSQTWARRAARLISLVLAPVGALLLTLAPPYLAPWAASEAAAVAWAAPPPAPPDAPSQAVLVAIPTLNVNLRVGPSTATARRRVVVSGEPLLVVDQSRPGWVHVRTMEGLDGWVASQYVTYTYYASAPTVASVQQAFAQGKAAVAALGAQPLAAQPAALQPATPAPAQQPAPAQARVTAPSGGITGIGDSIMLGAAGYLRGAAGQMVINAAVGRQAGGALDALRHQANTGQLGATVLVHIGTNGTFTAQQFDQLMGLIGQRRAVFVNIRVPRAWEGPNNAMLAAKVRQYPNAVLVDWHSVAVNRPDFFASDGVHLSAAGMQAYANTIAARLR